MRIWRGIQSIMKEDSLNVYKQYRVYQFNPNELHQKLKKSDEKRNESLADKLRSWAVKFYVKQRAITFLLKILKSAGLKSLPSDSRTLLSTPRFVEIQNRAGGQLWYNGIQNCLKQIFGKLSRNYSIEININSDGLPLFKSSPKEFWPILANIQGLHLYIYIYSNIMLN